MIIILLLYICLLCLPAFFFAYEKESPSDIFEGCGSTIILILGFPGAMLGYFIKESKDAGNQVKWEENKRQNEIAAKEQTQRITLLRTQKIEYFSSSPRLPEIIKFVTMHGMPYQISVDPKQIYVKRLNGHDIYNFASHGINNLPINGVDAYALGCAINNALGNQFTTKEFNYSWDSDGRYDPYSTAKGIELTRPLNEF